MGILFYTPKYEVKERCRHLIPFTQPVTFDNHLLLGANGLPASNLLVYRVLQCLTFVLLGAGSDEQVIDNAYRLRPVCVFYV